MSAESASNFDQVDKKDGGEVFDKRDDVDARSWAEGLAESVAGKATANMPVSKDADKYNMRHKKRGKAIILNHEKFINGQQTRSGTQADEHRLKVCLQSLGFEVIVHRDLKRQKLFAVIEDLAQEDHTDSDCLVICVLSHGELNKIYCSDSDYRPEDLWNPFAANLCPSLAGKPKIYFIQACRGDQLDAGTQLRATPNMRTQTDSLSLKDESIYVVPNRADFLVVYSTVEGYFSWRNTSEGSWFVQSLTKVLDEHKDKKDLLSMMTIVARNVALNFESFVPNNRNMDQKKQVPMISSTLIRDIYF